MVALGCGGYRKAAAMTRAEQLQPKVSNRTIAKTLGVGRRTIDRDTGPNGPRADQKASKISASEPKAGPNGPQPVVPHEISGARAAKIVERRREQQRRHRQRQSEGRRVYAVELDDTILDMLVRLRWLDRCATADDHKVGCAVRRLLVEAAKAT
jgi:hypothetical protein